ncbi:ATP-binding protein [Myxococcota bacterium]|nr:ATP-binding protein [Myxococcota bacterium]
MQTIDPKLGREREWAELTRLHASPQAELVFVLGRRRIGKSYTLSKFAADVGGLYYQSTRRSEGDQLAALTAVVAEHFDDPVLRFGAPFPDWERLFAYLHSRQVGRAQPLLLVLDEFTYLIDAVPALPSILQAIWDRRPADSRLKLILCGSYLTAMQHLDDADQPLFGRRTSKIVFRPFGFPEAGAFVPDYTPRDKLLAYGLVGHLPGNLARLDARRTLAENGAALLLSPASALTEDAERLLDPYVVEGRVHYSILEAIASAQTTWSGITKRVGMTSGAILRPLRWLEDMALLRRVVPVTESHPERSKSALYRITDPYLQIWYRRLAQHLRTGAIGRIEPSLLYTAALAPHLDDHMGWVFEELCREHIARGRIADFVPLRLGEYWSHDHSIQVDVVATDPEERLLVGECKWGRVTGAALNKLQENAARLTTALGTRGRPRLMLFTGSGEVDEAVQAARDAGEVEVLTGAELVG